MNAWNLEWHRLVRTRRLFALVGVFVLFGFMGPLVAAYLDELVQAGGGGLVIETPDPTPAMAIQQFLTNASQIGLLVTIVIAASALSLDARPEIGSFFRTRVQRVSRLLAPRYVVTTAAAIAAFVAGVLAAWYETVVLIGAPDAASMLTGTALTSLYLAFAVAVVAAAASVARNVLTTVAIAVAVLLLLPVVAVADAVAPYLPSELLGALPDLVGGGDLGDYLAPAVTSVVATAALFGLAVQRTGRREV
ncbi:MAG: hypothetical protein ACLFUG_00365 [Nitriliruptoraceae bacterium]